MRLLKLFIMPVLILSLTSCAMLKTCPTAKYDAEAGISESDARKIHNYNYMTQIFRKRLELKEKQVKELEKYNVSLAPEEKTIHYISVSRQKSGGQIGGKVFAVKGKGEFGNYELLVCIHTDKLINEILIKANPVNDSGAPVLQPEFLDQFIGRSVNKSFDFRENIDDYLYVPGKMASIKNAPLTSQDIALRLRKLLAIYQVALK